MEKAGVFMEQSSVGLWPGLVGGLKRCTLFSYALWIQHAPLPKPIAPMPDIQWQEAVGRRLLTPEEKAARCRYFDRKTIAGMAHCA